MKNFVFLLLALSLVSGCATEGDGAAPTNEPPPANHLPSLGSIVVEGNPVETGSLTAKAKGWRDEEGDPEQVRWRWLVNGKTVAGAAKAVLDGAAFSKGDSVIAEGVPFDHAGDGEAVQSAAIIIENSAPTLDTASIGGGPFDTLDTLAVAPGTFQDADGDAAGYAYRWFVNGAPVAGQTGATLDGAHFAKNDSVKAEVTPHDGDASGARVFSNTVVVQNSPPAATAAYLNAGPYRTGETVSVASVANWSDADGDAEGYVYVWYVDGIVVPGQTAGALAGTNFVKGQTVQAAAIPYDGEVTGAAVYTAVVTVANTAPVVTGVSLGAGPFYETSTLSAAGVAADADDADAPSLTYRWFVNGAAVAPATSMLTGSYFSKGDTVAVEVTPTDGIDNGEPVWSAPVTILNSLPSAVSASIGAGPYATNDTITLASVSGWSDPDGDSEAYQYVWFKNGVSLPTQTGTSLNGATQFSKNDQISLRVTPFDGSLGAAIFSNTVVIANTAPVVNSVSLGAGPYSKLSTLSASVTSSDADGDSRSVQYAWFVNGAVVAGQTAQTLSGAYFSRGDTVVVDAVVSDGALSSPVVQSASITIGNAAPTAPAVVLGPAAVTAGTALIWAVVPAPVPDADGDPVTYAYAWLKNGVNQGFPVSQTTVSGPFSAGDVWQFQVTPSDDQGGTGAAGTTKARILEYASRVAAGAYHTCALATTGNLYCWGANSYGQAGNPTFANQNEPYRVMTSASAVSDVAAGNAITCVLTTSGGVKCFGYGERIGNVGSWTSAVPVDVTGLSSGVRQIAATNEHVCAVLTAGLVKCWGRNQETQSGYYTASSAVRDPITVANMTDAVTVAVGYQHSCAIRADKTVSCWGYEYEGRLGNGANTNAFRTAAPVSGLANIVALGAGYDQTCAVADTGAMYCWGANYGLEIGGTTPNPYWQTTPKLMTGVGGITRMTGGDRFTEVLKSDGTIWGWGSNTYGELGVYTDGVYAVNYGSPVKATNISGIVQLDAGERHTCGVKATGGLVCWGTNYLANALGNGATSGISMGVTPIGFVP